MLLLARVKNYKVWNSSSFQWHNIRMKFCENPSGDFVSVESELLWVGWGLLRLRYVMLG
jgi:hypothetical protein